MPILERKPLLLVLLAAARPVAAEDWPQFRGPGGQGHSSERGLPLEWNEGGKDGKAARNIGWKVPIAGRGWSSPVVKGGRIWLTTALEGGKSLRAIALGSGDGRVLHDVEVFKKPTPGPIHGKNSHASPTPLLDDDRVYVHYGAHGTACVSADGSLLWRRVLEYAHRHGPAGSPILAGDLLVLSCDGTDVQFVAALDKRTGEIRWKTDRKGPMAYSTPLLIQADGREQIVSTGGQRTAAYDPRTGEEIWWFRYEGYSLVPRPVFGHGLVFLCSGYDSPVLYAVRPEGKGDITESGLVWSTKRGAPHNPSPLLVEDELYFVSDGGVASCADARTGKLHWQERLDGDFSASPIHADGRIYFLNEEGETTVMAPGREPKRLATNRVAGHTLASLAVSGGAIYLRTETHLYRLEERKG